MSAGPGAVSPRELALVFIMLAPLGILFSVVPPIPQDEAYHALADSRALAGVPNFGNVVSNLGFLVVGFMGLRLCVGRGIEGASRSWTVFFFGVLLVAFGSGYYHWTPNSDTLAWDRLPMTIAFMALFSALVAEYIRPEIERTLLRVAVAVGILSVIWWRYTGDLRFYAWVQFAPLLALLFIAIAFRARYTGGRFLVLGLVFYALAKVAEHWDIAIFAATSETISGHSLKHLLATVAPYCVYLAVRDRKPISRE